MAYFIIKQLPFLPPAFFDRTTSWFSSENLTSWLIPRILELVFTAWDLVPFARDCGYDGPPFRWDAARRFLLRCELDAAFFHLYGLGRDDAAYVLDTFPVVRKRDEAQHGEYRTARVILDIYDRMADAARTGVPYATLLDPTPADPRVAHPARSGTTVPARHKIKENDVYYYIALLLDAWKKPVRRDVLEAAIVLTINDPLRQAILGRRLKQGDRDGLKQPTEPIVGLDGFLDRMQVADYIRVAIWQGRHVLQLGPKAPSRDGAPTEGLLTPAWQTERLAGS